MEIDPVPLARIETELRIAAAVWRSIGPVARWRWRVSDWLDWLDWLADRVFPLGVVERETARHEAHYGYE